MVPAAIFRLSSRKTDDPRNSPDLNPLDYCIWDELAKGTTWAQVLTKQDSIDELHHATEKVRPEFFLKVATLRQVKLHRIIKVI